ncbi:MAG: serine hydrolase [Gordonia sp. (in: high G+C Gram-positive bacteria)]|uniref:serine hydrolase domain-containing protein n=1 Tax=Gordonia sp. (in: high G+C Gram-positive bacteria) TaxID=84139 RepID=UPI0039E384D4
MSGSFPTRRRLLTAAALATVSLSAVTGVAHAAPADPLPVLPHVVFYTTATMTPSSHPLALPPAAQHAIDTSYVYRGRRTTFDSYLQRTSARGLVVLRDGRMVTQKYWNGYTENSRFNSWSMGKSITSTAVGIALGEGKIASVDDPITKYLPELKKSGYNGVPIKHILQMSSGQKYDESNYANVTDGATGTTIRMVLGEPLMDQAEKSQKARTSGTEFNYASIDTFVLGALVTRVTGQPLPVYVQNKIWHPAGMASSALVGEDYSGAAMAYASYHATTRDFARFGELFATGGKAFGKQIVPADWVHDATRATGPQVQPGHLYQGSRYGYGYQWWVGDGDRGDFMAVGILGQYTYVWPAKNIVISQNSEDLDADANMEEAITAYRAVADTLIHGAS